MAVAAAVAGTAFSSTSNVASYATASWTPVAGRLYLVAVSNSDANDAIVPTLSGNGQTWTQVSTQQLTALTRRITVFRCLAASPSAGALTADFAGDAQSGCMIHISEWSGIDTGGTNGSGAIVQAVAAQWASAAPLVTLAAFSSANNGTYGSFQTGNETVTLPGVGFTQLSIGTYATPTSNLYTEWRADNDTSVDAVCQNNNGVGIAIEIKAAVAAADAVPYLNRTYPQLLPQ